MDTVSSGGARLFVDKAMRSRHAKGVASIARTVRSPGRYAGVAFVALIASLAVIWVLPGHIDEASHPQPPVVQWRTSSSGQTFGPLKPVAGDAPVADRLAAIPDYVGVAADGPGIAGYVKKTDLYRVVGDTLIISANTLRVYDRDGNTLVGHFKPVVGFVPLRQH
jgi:hypothetical protein